MKKSLLALAVLGAFAGVASAQSSVTIYGRVDQGVVKGNGGTAANQGANGTSEAWQLKQSSGSRLGFRGNEDLGGGLSAQFLIEHRFTPDNGAADAIFWAGSSYVQLTSTAAGSVYLGRTYVPAFYVSLKMDPFGYDGVGQVGAKGFANYLATGGVRTANTVGYKTPNLSGFTANAAVSLGEGALARDTGLNAEYTAGPIYVGLGYDKLTGGGAVDGNSLVNFGAAYNFGFVRPMFYFARSKTGVGSAATNKMISGALTAPIGPGVLKAVYYRLDPEGDNNTQNKVGVGYDYFLSKRTRLYADVGFGKEDNRTNNRAYNLGVRHDF